MSVRVDHSGFVVEGARLPWMAGACHYWRLDPARWPLILDRVRDLGFRVVQTYVPWSAHELSAGVFDFGERDPSRDLSRFLDLIHERGMKALLRPGPHINAEITYFGFPKRLFSLPECLSRSAQNTPVIIPAPPRAFPAPSYASEAFYREVGIWFDALAPILAARRHPKGPIIAVQADNEMALFFRTATYDQDYSEAGIALYRLFLSERYGSIEAVNARYRSKHRGFDEIEPPRDFQAATMAELPWHLDWVDAHEFLMAYAILRIRTMLEERGVADLAWFHNYPPGKHATPPFNVTRAEGVVDVQGADLYQQKHEYHFVRRVTSHLAATSRLPCLPEYSCGSTMWIKPLDLDDMRLTAMTALMHGIKGFSFYMLVERERWYGGAIDRHGEYRAETAAFVKELLANLDAWRFFERRKRAEVLLLANREYGRLVSASYLFSPMPLLVLDDMGVRPEAYCHETDFGLRHAPQMEHRRVWESFERVLGAGHFAFELGDTDIPNTKLARYSLVVVPSFAPMSPFLQQKLVSFVEAGGVLALGPEIPTMDWTGEPATTLADALASCGEPQGLGDDFALYELGEGTLAHFPALPPRIEGVADAIARGGAIRALLDRLSVAPICACDDPEVEVAWHDGKEDALLFVANPTDRERVATLTLPEGWRFVDHDKKNVRSLPVGPTCVECCQVTR